MLLLILSVSVVLVVSAACSLSEAGLYAVRLPYIRQLVATGSNAGRILADFKRNMERPITAILILNTAANTAGATVAGSQAREVFGENALIWFSALFTLSVLVFAEILPKVAGVAYNRIVARGMSLPLNTVIRVLSPLVRFSHVLTRIFPRPRTPIASEEEVYQFASLSAEEGSILPEEAELVRNALRLNDVMARDIMTPRTVVFKWSADRKMEALAGEVGSLPHARIPIHAADDPDNWLGVVLRRDILVALAKDRFDVTLADLRKPIDFVPETLRGNRLLTEFVERRTHLLGVLDEYGSPVGIVTLEDVMETLIGREIVDETDTVVDLQAVAREKGREQFGDALDADGDAESRG